MPAGNNILYLSIDCRSPADEWIGGAALLIHASAAANDPAARYVTARPLRTDVGSNVARSQISSWMRNCEEHPGCGAYQREGLLPTEVIDVHATEHGQVRIMETQGRHGLYATLSYCWGKDEFISLTTANYAELTQGFDESALPATLRDALATARAAAIRYLWIDALCIIQDSVNDKSTEIARMNERYSASALTIVAAAAKDVYEGFLHDRADDGHSATIPARISPGYFGTISVSELDAVSYDERLEPIAKRGWAMQEQILSGRTLTFTSRTMLWRCQEQVQSFGGSMYFPHDLDADYNDDDEKYSFNLHSLLPSEDEALANRDKTLSCWIRLVSSYSLRHTSLERDKLNALAGIASHPSFARTLGPGYYAGLWEYGMVKQLLWSTSTSHKALDADQTSIISRPTTYRAPSWSWASLSGGVVHCDCPYDEEADPPSIMCEIIGCETMPSLPNLNPFGEIAFG